MTEQWHGGKGSRPRPYGVDKKQFDDNWDRIFGKKEKKDVLDELKEISKKMVQLFDERIKDGTL